MADAWGEEGPINKVGTSLAIFPAVLGAMILSGFIPIELPVGVLFVVVAVCGVAGGILNLLGRGPIWIGAITGCLLALGGFGAVYFWINGRESVRKFELGIAFIVGAAPGFLLQMVLAKVTGAKPADAATPRSGSRPIPSAGRPMPGSRPMPSATKPAQKPASRPTAKPPAR